MAALVLYGSDVASTVAPTTACQMGTATGGTETSKNTTFSGGSSIWGELTSKGGTVATHATIPAPTGNGWVYSPGAGTFATGNWSAACYVGSGNGAFDTSTTIRFYKYSSGTYTLIGSITNTSGTTGKTLVNFAATSMSTVTFASGDLLYVDIWWQDNMTQADGDIGTIFESSSATAGVANDMQVTTSSFTGGGGGTTHHLGATVSALAGVSGTPKVTNVAKATVGGLYGPAATLVVNTTHHLAATVAGLPSPQNAILVKKILAGVVSPLAGVPTSQLAIKRVLRATVGPPAGVSATLMAKHLLAATVAPLASPHGQIDLGVALAATVPGLAAPHANLIMGAHLKATVPGLPMLPFGALVTTHHLSGAVAPLGQVIGNLTTGTASTLMMTHIPHRRFGVIAGG